MEPVFNLFATKHQWNGKVTCKMWEGKEWHKISKRYQCSTTTYTAATTRIMRSRRLQNDCNLEDNLANFVQRQLIFSEREERREKKEYLSPKIHFFADIILLGASLFFFRLFEHDLIKNKSKKLSFHVVKNNISMWQLENFKKPGLLYHTNSLFGWNRYFLMFFFNVIVLFLVCWNCSLSKPLPRIYSYSNIAKIANILVIYHQKTNLFGLKMDFFAASTVFSPVLRLITLCKWDETP